MSWVNDFEFYRPWEFQPPSETPPLESEKLSEVECDYIGQLEQLRPESWSELSPMERLDSLQELEDRLAEIQGRPRVEIRSEALGQNECGYYDHKGNIIVLAERQLDDSQPFEAIDTVAHEGRHAFQNYVVEHPEIHDDPVEVETWRENIGNYLTVAMYGYEIYRNQPIEADAWLYGSIVKNIFSNVSN